MRNAFSLFALLHATSWARAQVLRPHPLHDSISSSDQIHPRGLEDYSFDKKSLSTALDLLDEEHVMWSGDRTPAGDFPVATMHFETHSKEKVLNMQRFSRLISEVSCGVGRIYITFKSRVAFDYAAQAWDWVHLHSERVFTLLAHWRGCMNPEGHFIPFHFKKAVPEASTLTIMLEGIEVAWEEAGHTFTLHVGSGLRQGEELQNTATKELEVPSHFTEVAHPLPARNAGPLLEERFHIGHFHFKLPDPSISRSKGYSVHLDHKYNGEMASKHHLGQNGYEATSHCINCGSSGRIDISFRLRIKWFDIKEMGIYATAFNVGARLQWDLSLKANTIASLDFGGNIFEFPFPGLGFEIPKIFKMGLIASVGWGIGCRNYTGHLEMSHGIQFRIQDGAEAHIDLVRGIGGNGHWRPQVWSAPLHIEGKVKANPAASAGSTVGFEMELFKTTLAAGLRISAPSAVFLVKLNDANKGPCGQRTHRPSIQVDAILLVYLGMSGGLNGAFAGSEPIGKRGLIDGGVHTSKNNQTRRERLLDMSWMEPIFTEEEFSEVLESNDVDVSAHAAHLNSSKHSLHPRRLGFFANLPIYHHSWPLIKELCISIDPHVPPQKRSHPRDLLIGP
ncbi:BZ3500_MvSof-1268-A1-R1_Chr2-2g05124 [Microbotryum saponariae]|uniref:BZ3500_MvSof-1268-A1-R1_Chr2-2g05124 protein n=1 Tax=Microbotryum saponariae TaxID=289078 RepID=A0A2X0K8T0_9BASI|nr:BZ3500_MvSof-1268-A1-R1_Chr2-2g05124 [Microbotryum saponariae]SDA00951.1 BZ3501_MvSof-1269-A2-R1_Chr2-2g04798 [Microbotryum saponariae]